MGYENLSNSPENPSVLTLLDHLLDQTVVAVVDDVALCGLIRVWVDLPAALRAAVTAMVTVATADAATVASATPASADSAGQNPGSTHKP